ncbi:3-alpha,7-alpha,12-alpha-trihydroxy-5-beta-cholest-24-enoyl-CoA hydratase [Caulobacter sp. CCUG 60055]|uniref:MaoC/PaaZ C-terminal domain-containing protein n=1 Tax=Caulobacter sp. CCUG 60055 TaxID=2100090 RepID=UPI001FA812F3|nr:MaoC/PaaZ C-terminal domain-containing protein [Caulobacter sp. CCUG 60055]MBQ1543575.1 MaoC family dehydratase N-terminal domain-containing protein [Caulobacteraceae bacterium]MCI3181475.1 3-alpha,7-alpha,12-alpha-trihydroxy-5-beta-cholest-24-enoyl-CoA hydratase [Caulobacter sp. CCUG 60055]
MPISYPAILDLKSEGQAFAWTDRETMLYALGVGMGADPMDERELPFVYENGLKAVPTLATVVAWGAGPGVGRMGINFLMVVHGEQAVTFHRPMPTEASILADSRVIGAWDKGPGKGAVIATETVLKDAATGEPIATLVSSTFARGDGGFGGPADGQPEPHAVPQRAPDLSLDFATRPDQALIYRLSGDRNPLHADPKVAEAAGFPRPILHGLCTYGLTCRAVLQAFADYDPARIKSHQVRFSSPVFPGETVTVDLWRDGDVVSFEARVKARGVTVIKNGKSVLG